MLTLKTIKYQVEPQTLDDLIKRAKGHVETAWKANNKGTITRTTLRYYEGRLEGMLEVRAFLRKEADDACGHQETDTPVGAD